MTNHCPKCNCNIQLVLDAGKGWKRQVDSLETKYTKHYRNHVMEISRGNSEYAGDWLPIIDGTGLAPLIRLRDAMVSAHEFVADMEWVLARQAQRDTASCPITKSHS